MHNELKRRPPTEDPFKIPDGSPLMAHRSSIQDSGSWLTIFALQIHNRSLSRTLGSSHPCGRYEEQWTKSWGKGKATQRQIFSRTWDVQRHGATVMFLVGQWMWPWRCLSPFYVLAGLFFCLVLNKVHESCFSKSKSYLVPAKNPPERARILFW